MNVRSISILVALLLVIGLAWFVTRDEASDASLRPESTVDEPADPIESFAEPGQVFTQAAAVDARSTLASDDASASTNSDYDGLFQITGVLLDADGHPVHPATIGCVAFGRVLDNGARAMVPGMHGTRIAETQESGRFEINAQTELTERFRLQVSYAGHVTQQWESPQVVPGGSWDLGTITLARGGNLRVSVMDTQGAPIDDDWTVSVHWPANQAFGFRINDSKRAEYDRVAGYALLQDLPHASLAVIAESPRGGQIHRNDVEVIAGQTVDVALVYEGPQMDRMITVQVETGRFYALYPKNRDVRLIGPGTELRYPDDYRSRSERSFFDLAAGLYRAEVELEHFEPWTQVGIAPGTTVQAKLVPAAAIELHVVDGATSVAIERYAFVLLYERGEGGDELDWTVRTEEEAAPSDQIYRVPDVAGRIVIRADGYVSSNLPLDALRAGVVRPITVRLKRSSELRGRVVLADGVTPVANAIVNLRLPGEVAEYMPPGRRVGTRPRADGTLRTNPLQSLYADEAGRFQMELSVGTHAIHAWASPELFTVLDPLTIPANGLDEELLIKMPAGGSLFGRIVGGDPAEIAGLQVRMYRVPVADSSVESTYATVADDGSFRAGPFLPGSFKLLLQSESQSVEESTFGSSRPLGTKIEIGEVAITSDGDTQAEFDLSGRWPARLRFELRSSDRTAGGFSLSLESTKSNGGRPAFNTNSDGIAELRGIAPGDYTLYLRPRFIAWNLSLGELHVTPSQDIRLQHELVMIQGRAQLIDTETGEPFADVEVSMNSRSLTPTILQADTNGWVDFELPVGEFELQTRNLRPQQSATLRVTVSGASPQRIEFRSGQ